MELWKLPKLPLELSALPIFWNGFKWPLLVVFNVNFNEKQACDITCMVVDLSL